MQGLSHGGGFRFMANHLLTGVFLDTGASVLCGGVEDSVDWPNPRTHCVNMQAR